jgi:hypothetical protein
MAAVGSAGQFGQMAATGNAAQALANCLAEPLQQVQTDQLR